METILHCKKTFLLHKGCMSIQMRIYLLMKVVAIQLTEKFKV